MLLPLTVKHWLCPNINLTAVTLTVLDLNSHLFLFFKVAGGEDSCTNTSALLSDKVVISFGTLLKVDVNTNANRSTNKGHDIKDHGCLRCLLCPIDISCLICTFYLKKKKKRDTLSALFRDVNIHEN